MTALARGVQIRCLFLFLPTLSKVISKKLIFQKYFKISKFQKFITFDLENIFKKKLGFGLFRSS